MKPEILLTVLGLLLLALLSSAHESPVPRAFIVDGTLPPGRLSFLQVPSLQQGGHQLANLPVLVSMDLVKGL